ncbi:MAG: SLBB domain-containing protein [Candidatus Poribacteria bacterium]|nr:SLBB domain-containing protein [Candidatus Poribacteria bacterium]
MIYLRLICAVCLLIGVNFTAFADYRIEPGDTLQIVVIGQADYSQTVKVRADGMISYVDGDLPVSGKTPEEVRLQILEHLRQQKQLLSPNIMVSPLPAEDEIFVGGAVNLPNRYPLQLQDEIGLDHAIAMAGGADAKADLTRVQIYRQDGTVEQYDRSLGADYEYILVRGGDLVRVLAQGVVDVQGQVNKPGRILIQDGIQIGDALARAGGPDNRADLSKLVIVRRGSEPIEVNRAEPFWRSAKESGGKYLLVDGDTLYVPPLGVVEVQGQVNVPGSRIAIRDRIRVADAISRAGGADDRADLSELVITRTDGERVEISIPDRFWEEPSDGETEHYLYDGDSLYVPNAYEVETIYVLGYVRNPGAYKIRDPITPAQAIAHAGGEEAEANLGDIEIIRKDGSVEKINLKEHKKQMQETKILLHPGDSMRVNKGFQINWGLVLNFLSVTTVTIGLIISN